ncbi:MAG: hypothetical protein ACE5EE_09550, partial [Fidelibacterota bacterium]
RNSTFDWMGFPENNEIFIQRVNSDGGVIYGANGTRISSEASSGWHTLGDMKRDYRGGFVVGYGDFDSSRSYCRRIDLNGDSLWENTYDGGYIDINATDIEGNTFVSYDVDNRRQKLDLEGNHLWPDTLQGGIPDNIAYRFGGAFSDGRGGVIGAKGESPNLIKVNRVDSTGAFVFGEDGIEITGVQSYGHIRYASDDEGGIYLNWRGSFNKIQRVAYDGVVVFDSTNVVVCGDSSCGGSRGLVPDGLSGVITIWGDTRDNPYNSFYAQRIDSSGNLLWDSTGVNFHTTTYDPFFVGSAWPLVADGRG